MGCRVAIASGRGSPIRLSACCTTDDVVARSVPSSAGRSMTSAPCSRAAAAMGSASVLTKTWRTAGCCEGEADRVDDERQPTEERQVLVRYALAPASGRDHGVDQHERGVGCLIVAVRSSADVEGLPRLSRPPVLPFDTETNMNVLLLVPDGVSVRNFLLTGLPARAATEGTVDVLVGAGLAAHHAVRAEGVRELDELRAYPERLLEAPVRRTLEYSHLRWCDTPGTRFNLSLPIPGSGRSRALRRAAKTVSHATAGPRGIQLLVRAHDALADRRPEVDHYVDRLRDWGTDVVLCAHQRPLDVQPVVMAARRLGIPSATFIFSWDNLTTKGRIAAPFDHYLVWSDLMADELLRYYPDVTADRVHVVGTPQFEPYADPSLVWDRDRFDRELGLAPGRPVIAFSGGDTLTCPEDPEHLRILCELVRSGAIEGDPQVVLRPAPVDTSDRYAAVLADHPVVLSRPAWDDLGGAWTAVAPTRRDLELLVNLTLHADVNVNMASTMTLDFALHDTPVVNLGFDVDPTRNLAARYYRFDHYRPVVELGAARVARDRPRSPRRSTRTWPIQGLTSRNGPPSSTTSCASAPGARSRPSCRRSLTSGPGRGP